MIYLKSYCYYEFWILQVVSSRREPNEIKQIHDIPFKSLFLLFKMMKGTMCLEWLVAFSINALRSLLSTHSLFSNYIFNIVFTLSCSPYFIFPFCIGSLEFSFLCYCSIWNLHNSLTFIKKLIKIVKQWTLVSCYEIVVIIKKPLTYVSCSLSLICKVHACNLDRTDTAFGFRNRIIQLHRMRCYHWTVLAATNLPLELRYLQLTYHWVRD